MPEIIDAPYEKTYDAKYSIGDHMFEALPRIYRAKDAEARVAEVTVLNSFGGPVKLKGGQLQRFLWLCGYEADTWLLGVQDCILRVIDVDTCEVQYLPRIAKMISADLSPFMNDRVWREHIKSQRQLMQQKGIADGVTNFIKLFCGWQSAVVAQTTPGYGFQAWGTTAYGGGAALGLDVIIRMGAEASTDAQRAEKTQALLAVLPKYLPAGVAFELAFQ